MAHPWLLCVVLNAAFIPTGPHEPVCWRERDADTCYRDLSDWVVRARAYNLRNLRTAGLHASSLATCAPE